MTNLNNNTPATNRETETPVINIEEIDLALERAKAIADLLRLWAEHNKDEFKGPLFTTIPAAMWALIHELEEIEKHTEAYWDASGKWAEMNRAKA